MPQFAGSTSGPTPAIPVFDIVQETEFSIIIKLDRTGTFTPSGGDAMVGDEITLVIEIEAIEKKEEAEAPK